MSDSSEDEDMSRFKEAVDTTFTKLIHQSRGEPLSEDNEKDNKQKSERYLDVASHYNDVKVPEELQKQIGAKISAIINKNIEFVNIEQGKVKKAKVKGGVKLFNDSKEFLSCEDMQDTYTDIHNSISKKIKKKRRQIDQEDNILNENDKIKAVSVTGEYILSGDETKCWKSRRKEKIFKYKSHGNSKLLTSID